MVETFGFSLLYVHALFYSLEAVNLTILKDQKKQKSFFGLASVQKRLNYSLLAR